MNARVCSCFSEVMYSHVRKGEMNTGNKFGLLAPLFFVGRQLWIQISLLVVFLGSGCLGVGKNYPWCPSMHLCVLMIDQLQVVCHKHTKHSKMKKEQRNCNKKFHREMGGMEKYHSPWSLGIFHGQESGELNSLISCLEITNSVLWEEIPYPLSSVVLSLLLASFPFI